MRKTDKGHEPAARRQAIVFAIALATQTMLTGLPAGLLSGAAQALPRTCVIRTYFNNASHQTEVGLRSTCPGTQRWGRTSQFVEVERISLVPEGPSGPGGPGGLPCEFQSGNQAECNNIPTPRR